MSNYGYIKKTSLALGIFAASVPLLVTAQNLVLEEIIVTAQKKLESVQDVPATVNVLGESTLNEFEVRQLQDIEALTAGLSLSSSTTGPATISLRGITFNPYSGASASVQAYWNEIPVDSIVAFGQMYDMQSVEVLRGPQGTVQGRTSPGGSIQLFTKKANLQELDGNVQLTAGDRGRFNTQYAASLPLVSDTFGVRVAGSYDENDQGDVKSVTTGVDSEGRSTSGRLTLSWQAADDLTLHLTHQYEEVDRDRLTVLEGADNLGKGYPALEHSDRKTLAEDVLRNQQRNRLSVLNVEWTVGDYELASTSGYQVTSDVVNADYDYANLFEGEPTEGGTTSDQDVFSQELRLSSIEMENWEYLVGLYYEKRDSNATTASNTFINLPPAFGGLLKVFTEGNVFSRGEQYGVFTHHKINLNEALVLQLGARWQQVKSFRSGEAYTPLRDLTTPIIQQEYQSFTEEAVTGTVKLSYELTDDTMLYTSFDRGFRPGGVTITPTFEVGSENILYDGEDSTSLEFGVKTTLLDGRVQLNGATYYQQFSDYITRIAGVNWDSNSDSFIDETDARIGGGLTYNADAIIRGAEVEVNALVSEQLVAGLRLSYNDAKFDDGAKSPCNNAATEVGNAVAYCDVEGTRIGGEPNWSISSNAEYSIALDSYEWYLRVLAKYTGGRTNPVVANSDLGGYTVADIFTGIRDVNGQWDVSVWSKNLFDKSAKTDVDNNRTLTANGVAGSPSIFLDSGYRAVQVIDGRSIGVTGKYYF
ncbi:TonB-dependent receptor [Oceanicoccus sp. KOV_DT_Chl]|uniref:TonB-dependent receptor n=1 Tax=Oceanicoccus sp. KOV_DT_Chl TaxID=1904639 RepID=UPI00135AD91B|nr:TonB-dependent receptor [Oceanicoccus sp. KOV_DT_Chl]